MSKDMHVGVAIYAGGESSGNAVRCLSLSV